MRSTANYAYCYSLCSMTSNGYKSPIHHNRANMTNIYYCNELVFGNLNPYVINDEVNVEYEDLFKRATYENWDFENIWEIQEGKTTPYLKWMKTPPEEVTKEYIDAKIENNN